MKENEKKGGSPKGENRCPVCGRFVKSEVVKSHADELSKLRAKVAELSAKVAAKSDEAKKSNDKAVARMTLLNDAKARYEKLKKEYDALVLVSNCQSVELHRYERMGLFDRIFNYN